MEGGRVRVTLVRRLLEAAHDHVGDRRGDRGLAFPERGRRLREVREHHHRSRPGERRLAGEQTVERGAERVDVGPRVQLAALDLLGRHERGRARHGVAGELRLFGVGRAGDAEVAELHRGRLGRRIDQEVPRLDVAVHQPERVDLRERAGRVADDAQGQLDVELLARGEERVGALGPDQLHHQEMEARFFVGGDEARNEGALDPRQQPRLAPEALYQLRIPRPAGEQDLHRDIRPTRHVASPEHAPHSAGADLLDQLVGAQMRRQPEALGLALVLGGFVLAGFVLGSAACAGGLHPRLLDRGASRSGAGRWNGRRTLRRCVGGPRCIARAGLRALRRSTRERARDLERPRPPLGGGIPHGAQGRLERVRGRGRRQDRTQRPHVARGVGRSAIGQLGRRGGLGLLPHAEPRRVQPRTPFRVDADAPRAQRAPYIEAMCLTQSPGQRDGAFAQGRGRELPPLGRIA